MRNLSKCRIKKSPNYPMPIISIEKMPSEISKQMLDGINHMKIRSQPRLSEICNSHRESQRKGFHQSPICSFRCRVLTYGWPRVNSLSQCFMGHIFDILWESAHHYPTTFPGAHVNLHGLDFIGYFFCERCIHIFVRGGFDFEREGRAETMNKIS